MYFIVLFNLLQFHVKRLRTCYLNWNRALYKFRYNNNNSPRKIVQTPDNKFTIVLQAVQRGLDVNEALVGMPCISCCDSVSALFVNVKA